MSAVIPACGTPAAYQRHIELDIQPIDDGCIQAYKRALRRLHGLDDAPAVTITRITRITRADLDDTQVRAALTITGQAKNADDARDLLKMIGIIPEERTR